jgi:methionine sulfoxide reductase heme-binding subunit
VSHDPTFWILARAAGFAAYLLLTASVLAGLALKARVLGRAVRPATVVDLHRTLAMLGLGFLAVHGTALALDTTVRIPPVALLVPGLAPYRPVATGIGVVAAELMVLVYASFGLRRRIGIRSWRTIHWLTYGVFAGATVHGLTAGSDSARPWALGVYLGSLAAVAVASAWRFLTVEPKGAPR